MRANLALADWISLKVNHFLARLQPDIAYLAVPTRLPAELWVHPPSETRLHRAYDLLAGQVARVEYLLGYEGNAFSTTGDVRVDLLSITAVHPMRQDTVQAMLAQVNATWDVVTQLLANNLLVEILYGGHHHYLRKPVNGRIQK